MTATDRTTIFLPLAPDAPAQLVPPNIVTPDAAVADDDAATGWTKYTSIWKAHHQAPEQAGLRRFLALPIGSTIDLKQPPRRSIPTYLPWSRGNANVWHTNHFEIVTRLPSETIAPIATDLEQIYWAWTQLFFPIWSQSERVSTVLAPWNPDQQTAGEYLSQRTLVLGNPVRHRIVLLNDAEDYQATLVRPQVAAGDSRLVAASTGFYSDSLRTVFLYPDGDSDSRRHEVCHQLFSEASSPRPVPPLKVRNTDDFWLVEGIAGYFESMSVHEGRATFGGWDSTRLQYARYRALIQDQTPALESELKGSATTLNQRADIASWYNQSILRSHAMMDGFGFAKRGNLLAQLGQIYGRPLLNGKSQASVDPKVGELRQFLIVDDDHLQTNPPSPGAPAICLAACPVTLNGIASIPQLTQIQWLDLSRLPVTDVELIRLVVNVDRLSQLSLEATKVTSQGIISLLNRKPPLLELDLSWTQVDDSAMQAVARQQELETLWLTGCPISDEAIDSLLQLKSLQTLDVQRTRISEKGVRRLKEGIPQLSLNPLHLTP